MNKIRILFEGHDLKFLTYVIDHYKINHRYHVDVFTYEGHVIKDVREIIRILPDIDIIFCEWGLGNLQWFSHNKLPGQKLVTRIHSQEFTTNFLAETKWENVDNAIVVGPYMKERFDLHYPGISEKCQVIPNLVNTDSFHLAKAPGAAFNLGLLGILPMIKAPHLALEILRELHQLDNRYKLFVKGRRPEEVPWLWRRPEEQVYYTNFYKSIEDYGLQDSVILEPHGQDVQEWFRKIGFILSPSEYESFHMAIAEGMASCAIPVIRNWTGSDALFPGKYIFSNQAEAVYLIRSYADQQKFLEEGVEARHYCTEKYDLRVILPQYDHILLPDFKPAELRKEFFQLLEQRNRLEENLEQSIKLREKADGEVEILVNQQKILVENTTGLAVELTEFRKTLQVQENTILSQETTINQQQSALAEQLSVLRLEQAKNLDKQSLLKQQHETLKQQQETLKQQQDIFQQQQDTMGQLQETYRHQQDSMQQLLENNRLQLTVNQQYADQLVRLEQELSKVHEVLQHKTAECEDEQLQVQQLNSDLAYAGERLKSQQLETMQAMERLGAENMQIRQHYARELEQQQKTWQDELLSAKTAASNELALQKELFQRENKQARELQDNEIARLGTQLYNEQYHHRETIIRMEAERMRMQTKMDHLRDINLDLERRLLATFGSLSWKVGAFLIKKPMDLMLLIKRKLLPSK